MSQSPAPLHIFFAGTHTATDGTAHAFSQADIADLVASYDPELSDAPLVVGHPKIEDPAYGSVGSLTGDAQNVFATPRDVDAQFAELVNAGRFPKISASIYLPGTPGNPKPGHHYLRHVGFLGGAAPSIKGLKRPTFNCAENDGALEFAMPMPRRLSSLGYYLKRLFQGLRDSAIERDGAEKAEQLIPQWCIDGIDEATEDDQPGAAFAAPAADTTEIPMTDKSATDKSAPDKTGKDNAAADFAEQQSQLDTRQTDIDKREKTLKQREDDALRADAVEFAEGLVADGKLLPRQQPGVVELLLAFPAGAVLNFAEADGQDATDHASPEVLRAFLTDLPQRVDFAEKSAGQHNGTAAPADFAAPAGAQVDARLLEIHAKAQQYQREHPNTDYLAAIKAVGG